jgi:hypothetical protein
MVIITLVRIAKKRIKENIKGRKGKANNLLKKKKPLN